jgi:hypothetical protein
VLTPYRIKVLALIVFFILAICISAGAIGPKTIGFRYWHDPGAFADGINGVAKTFVVAGTLYAGTEMWVTLLFFSPWILRINYVQGGYYRWRIGEPPNSCAKGYTAGFLADFDLLYW